MQNANLLTDALNFASDFDESSQTKLMYFTLVHYANKNFWRMPFVISDRQLATIMSVDSRTLKTVRERLITLGKIKFETFDQVNYYTITAGVEHKSNINPAFQQHLDSDKPQADAVKTPSKQNKTKLNKTKQNKTIDRSKARAGKSEKAYETEEVVSVGNDIQSGVVLNPSVKTGGVTIADTQSQSLSSINPDPNSDTQTVKVEIKQISDDELRALAAFDSLVHPHTISERDKLLAMCEDYGAEVVMKCISKADQNCRAKGDRIQSVNLISAYLRKEVKLNERNPNESDNPDDGGDNVDYSDEDSAKLLAEIIAEQRAATTDPKALKILDGLVRSS